MEGVLSLVQYTCTAPFQMRTTNSYTIIKSSTYNQIKLYIAPFWMFISLYLS
jgi:hypothetical protein